MVAVAGEALVDIVLECDGRATAHLGGGSFNTARTIGRLGQRPVFVGRLSRDGSAALNIGGLGLVFEPQAIAIATLVREAEPETLILLDPNCRPDAARDAVVYRERLREVLQRADVVKASEEDLSYLEPERAPLQTARGRLELGRRWYCSPKVAAERPSLRPRGRYRSPHRKHA